MGLRPRQDNLRFAFCLFKSYARRKRLINLKNGLRFPCLGPSPIINYITSNSAVIERGIRFHTVYSYKHLCLCHISRIFFTAVTLLLLLLEWTWKFMPYKNIKKSISEAELERPMFLYHRNYGKKVWRSFCIHIIKPYDKKSLPNKLWQRNICCSIRASKDFSSVTCMNH